MTTPALSTSMTLVALPESGTSCHAGLVSAFESSMCKAEAFIGFVVDMRCILMLLRLTGILFGRPPQAAWFRNFAPREMNAMPMLLSADRPTDRPSRSMLGIWTPSNALRFETLLQSCNTLAQQVDRLIVLWPSHSGSFHTPKSQKLCRSSFPKV